MTDTKTFPMSEVRKIIGDEAQKQFGAMTGVKYELRTTTFTVETEEESYWERAKVDIVLETDIYGEEVSGYYINYSSRWQSAEFASRMSVLIGGVSSIAKKLEVAGLTCAK